MAFNNINIAHSLIHKAIYSYIHTCPEILSQHAHTNPTQFQLQSISTIYIFFFTTQLVEIPERSLI